MAILLKFRGKGHFHSHIETREKWSVKRDHQKNSYIFYKKVNAPSLFFSPQKNGALKNFFFLSFNSV